MIFVKPYLEMCPCLWDRNLKYEPRWSFEFDNLIAESRDELNGQNSIENWGSHFKVE